MSFADKAMKEIQTAVSQVVNASILRFTSKVSERYPQVTQDELMKIWRTLEKNAPTPPVAKISSESSPTCPAIVQSGQRKGECCGAKITKDGFCGRHAKQANEGSSSSSKPSKPSNGLLDSFAKSKPVEAPLPDLSFIPREDYFYNKLTNLVIYDPLNPVVVGVYDPDKKEVFGLDERDIENCKRYGFTYKLSPEDDLADKVSELRLDDACE